MFGIKERRPALIFAEGEFGGLDGKTANGLVRFSPKYEILGVIDSDQINDYVHEVLDDVEEEIPIFSTLEEALGKIDKKPRAFINGIARDGGAFPYEHKDIFLSAMEHGMDIVTGTQEYLTDDKEFVQKAKECNVEIWDVRKPVDESYFISGKIRIDGLPPRIHLVGTDCAIGKRTTCVEIYKELKRRGYNPAFVATGQTGLMQGAKYGTPLDAVKGDFLSGKVEHEVWKASQDADIVIIEGQACITHPQGGVPLALLKGCHPHGVIIQHAPGREHLDGLPNFPPPNLEAEWETVEFFYPDSIFAITINHENGIDPDEWVERYEDKYGLPASDVLVHGPKKIVDAIEKRFLIHD